MPKPIPDKAEVTLEYPDKLYMGTFGRSARFDAGFDKSGISLALYRDGDESSRKSVHVHLHYALFADILCNLAETASLMPSSDVAHREALSEGAKALHDALENHPVPSGSESKADQRRRLRRKDADDIAQMSPEEEVLLLHVLE